MIESEPVREFALLVAQEDDEVDLAVAALLIARTEYPSLDIAANLQRLDRLAAEVRAGPTQPPFENVEALNKVLFEEENFSGNEEEYDDPRNSYLNDVLESKKGIPITLSLVYTEVARRKSLPVVGVGFPGHFLVKYLTVAGEILIDPYHRGTVISREDCIARLKTHFGEEAELRPEFLEASTHKQILARMLNNLKGSYFRRRNFSKVLTMVELALAIDPGSRHDVRDRGMVYFLMGRHREALGDLKAYLSLSPPDDPQAREVKQALTRIRAMMN